GPSRTSDFRTALSSAGGRAAGTRRERRPHARAALRARTRRDRGTRRHRAALGARRAGLSDGGAPAASRRAHAPRRRGPPAATRDRPADAARLPDHHRLPRSKEALDDLVRDGRATRVEGIAGKWYAYAPLPGERFRPRTTLLCPFDKLIADRDRTEAP